jgi:hypothetical protein
MAEEALWSLEVQPREVENGPPGAVAVIEHDRQDDRDPGVRFRLLLAEDLLEK